MRAGQISVSPSRYAALGDCPWQVYLRDIKKIPPRESDRFTFPGRVAHYIKFQLYSIMRANPGRFKDMILGGNAGNILERLYMSLVPPQLKEGFSQPAIYFSKMEARRLKRILEVVPKSESWRYFIPAQLETMHVISENYIIFINDFTTLYPARYFDIDDIPPEMRNRNDEYAIGDYKPGKPGADTKWRVDKVKTQINFESAFIDSLPKPARYGRAYFYRTGEEYVFPTSDTVIGNIKEKVPVIRKMLNLAQDRHELKQAINGGGLEMSIDPEDEAIFRSFWFKKPSKFACGWCPVRYHCFRKTSVSDLIANTITGEDQEGQGEQENEVNDEVFVSSNSE